MWIEKSLQYYMWSTLFLKFFLQKFIYIPFFAFLVSFFIKIVLKALGSLEQSIYVKY